MAIVLPKVFEIPGKSIHEIIENFIVEMEILSQKNDFFYSDQIISKCNEYLRAIESISVENSLLRRIREKWSKTLCDLFIHDDIHFEMNMRIKSVISFFSKMNKIMADGESSINWICDLIGLEIIIYTSGYYDTEKTICDCYKATNISLDFFANKQYHEEDVFKLTSAASLKKSANPNNPNDIERLQFLNPHIIIPQTSLLDEKYRSYVKDYIRNPKITTAYQGLQFVVQTTDGIYLEIQVKSQSMRDYLDSPKSPGAHAIHKNFFVRDKEIPQFDLAINEENLCRIYGFRPDPEFDRSGILSPLRSTLRRSIF